MLLLPLAAAGNRRWRAAGLLVLMFGGGFYYAAWRADMRLAERLPQELIWQDVWAEGTIRGFAETTWRRSRFVFDIEKIGDPPAPFNLRASVSDYHFNKPPLEGLRDGAKWRLKIRVRPPRNNYNPNGFDRAGWFFSRGIRAEGYVRDRKSAALLEEGGGLRDSLRQQTRAMPERGELLAALIVGDRGGIDEKQWRVLRQTGVAHLMSISGTHITLTAVFAALLVGFVWRRNRRLTQRMPAQKAALLAAIPLAVFYAWLAGFGVPVQRSLLMFLAAAAAMLFGIGASPIRTVFPAAALVIAVDPWAVLSAGFWLSFLIAAAVIAALVRGNYVFRLLKMQFVVSLFAMPLTLWFFNEASLVSPLANAVAVPFAGLVILPLTLADIVVPGDFLWRIAGHGLSLLMSFLEFCSELPFASRQTAAPWHVFVAAALGGGWLLMPTGTPLALGGSVADCCDAALAAAASSGRRFSLDRIGCRAGFGGGDRNFAADNDLRHRSASCLFSTARFFARARSATFGHCDGEPRQRRPQRRGAAFDGNDAGVGVFVFGGFFASSCAAGEGGNLYAMRIGSAVGVGRSSL